LLVLLRRGWLVRVQDGKSAIYRPCVPLAAVEHLAVA